MNGSQGPTLGKERRMAWNFREGGKDGSQKPTLGYERTESEENGSQGPTLGKRRMGARDPL